MSVPGWYPISQDDLGALFVGGEGIEEKALVDKGEPPSYHFSALPKVCSTWR